MFVLAMCRSLNMMAFVKILKKFEKITGKQVLSIYLKVVETSYFNSSDEACVLTYIHFARSLCQSKGILEH
jgi:SPX domain protein involved in polyphosphate accumulation